MENKPFPYKEVFPKALAALIEQLESFYGFAVLEDQLNEVSKTKGDYNRMLTIYGKYKSMLQTANTKINA